MVDLPLICQRIALSRTRDFQGLVVAELSPSSDSSRSQLQLVSTQQMVGIQQGLTSVFACLVVMLSPTRRCGKP